MFNESALRIKSALRNKSAIRNPHSAITSVALIVVSALLGAHGRDARYVEEVRWKKDHVTRTFAASRSELGLAGTKRKVEMKAVGDRMCAVPACSPSTSMMRMRSTSTSRST